MNIPYETLVLITASGGGIIIFFIVVAIFCTCRHVRRSHKAVIHILTNDLPEAEDVNSGTEENYWERNHLIPTARILHTFNPTAKICTVAVNQNATCTAPVVLCNPQPELQFTSGSSSMTSDNNISTQNMPDKKKFEWKQSESVKSCFSTDPYSCKKQSSPKTVSKKPDHLLNLESCPTEETVQLMHPITDVTKHAEPNIPPTTTNSRGITLLVTYNQTTKITHKESSSSRNNPQDTSESAVTLNQQKTVKPVNRLLNDTNSKGNTLPDKANNQTTKRRHKEPRLPQNHTRGISQSSATVNQQKTTNSGTRLLRVHSFQDRTNNSLCSRQNPPEADFAQYRSHQDFLHNGDSYRTSKPLRERADNRRLLRARSFQDRSCSSSGLRSRERDALHTRRSRRRAQNNSSPGEVQQEATDSGKTVSGCSVSDAVLPAESRVQPQLAVAVLEEASTSAQQVMEYTPAEDVLVLDGSEPPPPYHK